jgi:hypothetical protein
MDSVWPLLVLPVSVEKFRYRENGHSLSKEYEGRGIVHKILTTEFLEPAKSNNIAVRGELKIYKSGKSQTKIDLYKALGHKSTPGCECLIPLDKSFSFTHVPS